MNKIALGALAAVTTAVFTLGLTVSAHAVSLTLEGAGTGVSIGNSQALWASDSTGRAIEITAVGLAAPGGGKVSELGVPSMMSDGRVVFGAEITTKGERGSTDRQQWNIFIGDPDASASSGHRMRALEIKSKPAWCNPVFHGDPYPVADGDGQLAFMAALGRDRDGLMLYSHGSLSCLAETATRTNEGDQIAVLSFGSAQMGEKGEVVFNAWLKGTKAAPNQHVQALLLASRDSIHELAVEGQYGPNHTQYLRPFGLPAAVPSPQGTLVAFTAKSPTGSALFLYDGSGMVRELQTATDTPLGPVSYLSPGRPGLISDGTVAVLAGCARTPVIFRLAHGLMDLRIERGQLTPLGSVIESLGDPVLTASGTMFVGATDTDGHEQLYVLDNHDELFEVGSPEMLYRVAFGADDHQHTIFTGTLTVNQHGDYAYLGGQ